MAIGPIPQSDDFAYVKPVLWNALERLSRDMEVNNPLPIFTVADLPAGELGQLVYCSNGDAGSACLAVFDGTNWVRVAFGATVSAT